MTSRQLPFLLLLAALLLALSAYLALGGEGDGLEGLAYPGEVGDVIPPSELVTPLQGGEKLPVVRLEIEPVARLLEQPSVPRCRLLRGAAGDDEVPARVLWLAGSAAVPVGREPPSGEQLVAFELAGGERLYRVVRLDAGDDEVEVRLEGPFAFEGRVLDADGHPIAGARAWLDGRPEVRTDAEGRFRVDGVRGRAGLPLVLRAEGYADHFRVLSWPQASPEPLFHLQPGVELGVQLAAALPEEGVATVFLRPPGGAGDGSSSWRHFPFFWPAVGEPLRLSSDGSCVLLGLPRGETIEVVVHHPLLVTEPIAIDLRKGRQNAVVQGRRGPAIRGTVTDESGAPAAGALITCRTRHGQLEPRQSRACLLAASAQLAHVTHAFAAADGSFAIVRGDTSEPQWITVLAKGALGIEREIRGADEIRGARFALPALGPIGDNPALRLHPTRALRLVVVRGGSADRGIELRGGEPYLLPLREPALLDVTVQGADGRRHYPGLAVRGVVDLDV